MASKTLLTVEQFLQSPEMADERRRFELRNGERFEMGIPSPWHNQVRDRFFFSLTQFVDDKNLGRVVAEQGIQIDSNSWYVPDVAFWDSARWATIDQDRSPIQVMPQLVIEVVSPSEPGPLEKADDYLRAGVHTVWVAFRRPYEIHILERAGGRRIVRAGEKLEAPVLLPGFSVDAAHFLPK